MNTIRDSTNSLTRHKPTNKFRMHQNDKNPEDTKTIISFKTIIDSAVRMDGGTGTLPDMITLTAALQFCEDKIEESPKLGFKRELGFIRQALGNIIYRASPSKDVNANNWHCPFVTMAEQNDIEKLVFLIEYQYTNEPSLDTSISLNDNYNRFINQKEKEL